MPQLGYGNTSGDMPCGSNAFGDQAGFQQHNHQMHYSHMAYLHWYCHNQAAAYETAVASWVFLTQPPGLQTQTQQLLTTSESTQWRSQADA